MTYKSYYNIAPSYLCEMINKKESHVNTPLGTDHHQLIMPPISKDFSNTFLERSFIYAAPCKWNKLSETECIRTSNFDRFMKSVKPMLFTQQYNNNNICLKSNIQTSSVDCAPLYMDADCKQQCIYYCYLCCDHC